MRTIELTPKFARLTVRLYPVAGAVGKWECWRRVPSGRSLVFSTASMPRPLRIRVGFCSEATTKTLAYAVPLTLWKDSNLHSRLVLTIWMAIWILAARLRWLAAAPFEKSIRLALAKIGVVGKQIGWHSFRHSLATNLRSLGVDIKVAQELMRHSSCRTTLDVYTRAVDQQKREASLKVIELTRPLEIEKFHHPSAPSTQLKAAV